MTSSLDLINEFEKTFEVEKWTVNGLHIWPAIRVPLMTAWEQKLYYTKGEFSQDKKVFSQKVLSELNLLWVAIRTCSFFLIIKNMMLGFGGYQNQEF